MKRSASCLLKVGLCGALAATTACASQAPKHAQKRVWPSLSGEPQEPALIGPARYVLTEGVGVSFDEASEGSPLQKPEGAIVSGKRMLLQGGVILARTEVDDPDPLLGFRSIPARLGGGMLLWSDARTYRADSFLGALQPVADIAASGGARPWLRTMILRTEHGLVELDPKTQKTNRTDVWPYADALAVDAQRGARLDLLGRLEITTDGGKTYRDVTAEKGGRFFEIRANDENAKLFFSIGYGRAPTLELSKDGALMPFSPMGLPDTTFEVPIFQFEDTAPHSHVLAPVDLANTVFAGVRLRGNRALSVREGHLRVLALSTGQIIDDAPMPTVGENLGRCQPVLLGEDVRLACTHAYGAHVMALSGNPSAPRLEATFGEPSGFVAGIGKRFAFNGRCGSVPPSPTDFRGLPPSIDTTNPNPPPDDDSDAVAEPDTPDPSEAFVCVRSDDGTWLERKLEGRDAERLYRFLPSGGGNLVALVLRGDKQDEEHDKSEEKTPEGVRVVRLNVDHPKLKRAQLPALPDPMQDAPHRSIDQDFWIDESDGSIHGWALVSGAGEDNDGAKNEDRDSDDDDADRSEGEEPEPRELVAQSRTGRMLPIASRFAGGPAAGLRISKDGAIEVYPVPKGVVETIRGGRFALARADVDAGATWYETTNGGQTWTPVEPAQGFDFIVGMSEVQGCSPLGCALGDGTVRLGWTSPAPKPEAPKDPQLNLVASPPPPPMFPRLNELSIRCDMDKAGKAEKAGKADKPSKEQPDEAPRIPVVLRLPNNTELGRIKDSSFEASLYAPFEAQPPRKISMKLPSPSAVAGEVVPVLLGSESHPVGLYVRSGKTRLDLGLSEPAKEAFSFPFERRMSVAVELGPSELVALEADLPGLSLIRKGLGAHWMGLDRVPEVTRSRLTLARRIGKGTTDLAIAAISGVSGEILLGELDLARTSVGPLRPLASLQHLESAPVCHAEPSAFRMLVEVLANVHFEPEGENADVSFQNALALVAVSPGHVCLEGVELRLGETTRTLGASFTAKGKAVVRDAGVQERATCSVQ